jgi:hypothetical protein
MWYSQGDDYEGRDNHNSSQKFIGVSEGTDFWRPHAIYDKTIHNQAANRKCCFLHTWTKPILGPSEDTTNFRIFTRNGKFVIQEKEQSV